MEFDPVDRSLLSFTVGLQTSSFSFSFISFFGFSVSDEWTEVMLSSRRLFDQRKLHPEPTPPAKIKIEDVLF